MDFISHYLSPLGGITLASDGQALVGLWFDRQKFFADTLDKDHSECDDLPVFWETKRWEIIARERNIRSMSAQAVGGAVAHNSISLIIPCHRVVGTDGSLTGYAGGIDRKQWLLRMEKEATRSRSLENN